MKRNWKKYLDKLTNEERHKILVVAIERLMELEEVKFQMDDIDCAEMLYWDSCGDELLKED